MRRFFLQLIIFFYSIYCFIIFPASQNVGASTINESNESQHQVKPDKTESNKSSQSNKKKPTPNPSRTLILVPPPPPEQPSLLDWSSLGNMSESLSLLNEEELKQKLANLRKEITNDQLGLEENNADTAEAKDKAERFVSLYSEGVVSRKELEVAKKEVGERERLSQGKKSAVEDLKAQENAILRRLASFRKNSKSKQHANKKKNSNAEKQKQ